MLFLLKEICHFDQVEITPHHGQLTCGLLRSASVRIHSSFMTLNGLLSSSDPRPTVNSGNGTVADCMPPTQGLASWQQALILGSGGNQNETLVFYFSPIFFFIFLVGENSLLQLSRTLEVDPSKKSGFPSKAFPPWKNRE